MRDTAPCDWQRWRIAPVARPDPEPVPGRFTRTRRTARGPANDPSGRSEAPGPDGIRHALVARVRREIEAGIYDTEEKWLAAEEKLLRRVAGEA
ncbi:MAG TPA: hypothetical protein VKE74_22495 [Gemmataceae bacterium]|nr:hypothetical protein [Gemmataceae bacterium]